MSKHTPGPWNAEADFFGNPVIFGPARVTVTHMANVPMSRATLPGALKIEAQEVFANARLIAAAPDMLWCLEQIQAGETMTPEMILAIAAAIHKAIGSAS